jgi:cathepsin A (carboxypeptidase C)
MRPFTLLSLGLPYLVAALPAGFQRPMLLDDLKAGNFNPPDLKTTCGSSFATTDQDNGTICVSVVSVKDPKVDNKHNTDYGKSQQYCGYVENVTNERLVRYYFWLVMSETNPVIDPLVLWLNGGPGASSLLGLFDQWGPRLFDHDQKEPVLKDNPNRMTEKLSWVFLEQPVGTGFTASNLPANGEVGTSTDAATDVLRFLDAFMQHPFPYNGQVIRFINLPYHVAGESYAGHYIPAIGQALVGKHTVLLATPLPQSLIIGNGQIDARMGPAGMFELFCGETPSLKAPKDIIAARCPQMPNGRRLA